MSLLGGGFTVWLTGLPGTGKTTLARTLCGELERRGLHTVPLDGDDVRRWLTPDLGFSREDRRKNVFRVAEVAVRVATAGGVALVALVSPYEEDRVEALAQVGPSLLVWLQGGRGELWPGTEYEPPKGDHLGLPFGIEIEAAVAQVLSALERRALLASRRTGPALFIGRFQPFHDGHRALIERVLAEGRQVMIALRDTPRNQANPWSIAEREARIREALAHWGDRVAITSLPDFDEICFGRTPGYGIRQIRLKVGLEALSGTTIREQGAVRRQGNIVIVAVKAIPPGAIRRAGGVLGDTDSSGLAHSLELPDSAELLEAGGELYLRVAEEPATIVHEEHPPIVLPPGQYRVFRQSESIGGEGDAISG